MAGKYMPMEASSRRKATKLEKGEEKVPPVEMEHVTMETTEQHDVISRMVDGRKLRLSSKVFIDEPIIIQTMKQEKTKPSGQCPTESRTGVHRKTNMYIIDSNMDCTTPKRKMMGSLKMTRNPSRNDPCQLTLRLP